MTPLCYMNENDFMRQIVDQHVRDLLNGKTRSLSNHRKASYMDCILSSAGKPKVSSFMGVSRITAVHEQRARVFIHTEDSLYSTTLQICVHWLKQCFWNYLDWRNIVQYIALVLILGVDYQVYICVAALRHLRQLIVQRQQTQDLVVFLKEEPIQGFQVADQLNYMQDLEKRHRKTILSDMISVTKS